MRVLIVEDDAALARGILKVFRNDGLAVDHVSRGQDALDIIEMESYSAVILDLGLPDMDGMNVLRQIRKARITVPILILTARDATIDRVNGLDNGADDYLAKPFANEPPAPASRVSAIQMPCRCCLALACTPLGSLFKTLAVWTQQRCSRAAP